MPKIVLLVMVIRALAIGQVLLVALVILRSKAPRQIRAMSALLLLCACCYLTLWTPIVLLLQGPFWPLVPLCAQLVPLCLWVFAHQLFERQIDWRIAAANGGVLVANWIVFNVLPVDYVTRTAASIGVTSPFVLFGALQRLVHLSLLAHAMIIALSERGDDLIEARRRLRVGFVIALCAMSVMVIGFEQVFGPAMPWAALLFQAAIILGVTCAVGAALLESNADLLFDPAKPKPEPRFSPSEHVLNQKLEAAMASGGYREMSLTIGALADKLGAPEHRLRALINQRLGYRNFSAYLNEHRIAEAKTLLASADHVDLPILTIAMNLGYGSLAPFNRAFREAEGQAPSEFRRAAILPD